jgi:phthalate 4,5-dioxygenase
VLTHEENELLTRVGPGTPMGAMLRRYWLPACLTEEIPEADGDPVRVRLLGEDLVAFRDTEGRVGLLKELCPHRGASLFYGRNEEGGVRCLYHGWKMDVAGNVVDMPCEPAGSDFKTKVRQVAYPTHEEGDIVWAYMGPPDKRPSFRSFEWSLLAKANRSVAKVHEVANWVQALEGGLDSSHVDILHLGRSILRGEPYEGPQFDVADTAYGLEYAATRRFSGQSLLIDIQTDQLPQASGEWNPEHYKYVRLTRWVAPFFCFIPALVSERLTTIFVPIDDEHTWYYNVFFDDRRPVDHQKMLAKRYVVVGPDLNPDYTKKRTRANNYWQDRAAMRAKRTYSGIDGNPTQDMAMLESMGPIYDRSQEHLGVSDLAVIRLRRRLLDSLRAFLQGSDPIGLDPSFDYTTVRSHAKVVPTETPWQELDEAPSLEIPALA